MHFLYSLCFFIITPFAILRLIWRSRKNPGYRKRMAERLSLKFSEPQKDIWIHTVSVGEFLATMPLIEALLSEGKTLLITTTTPTGSSLVTEKLAHRVSHQYLPFDTPLFARRFVNTHQPKVAVFVETEIWPNYLSVLKKNNTPTLLINARLSQKSFRGYKKLGNFGHDTLANFTEVACQNEVSADRFKELGAHATHIGNIKFDIQKPHNLEHQQAEITEKTKNRSFILAASTHNEEESLIFEHYQQSQEKRLLVIAPRHPERSSEVLAIAEKTGLTTCLYSKINSIGDTCNVVIIDTLGLLLPFYSLADYAIIGGSFIPHGGHNPLEAALFSTPCVIGEYHHNFQSLIDEMIANDAIYVIARDLLFVHTPSQKSGVYAHRFLSKNQGATQKYLSLILNKLPM